MTAWSWTCRLRDPAKQAERSQFCSEIWRRGRESSRQSLEPNGRPGTGRCIWFEMGRGPKAGYRGGALQSSSLRRSTKRQAGSSIAVPPRPKTHRSRPRPGHEKTRRGDPGGHGSTPVFPNSCQMDLLVKRECWLCSDTFPPIGGRSPSESGQLHDQRLPRAGARRCRRWTADHLLPAWLWRMKKG